MENPDYGQLASKRFSEFLGGKRKRFSEFLGGKKRFSEFLGGKRKRFSEFLGGKRSIASPNYDDDINTQLKESSELLRLDDNLSPFLLENEEPDRIEKRFSEFLGGKRSGVNPHIKDFTNVAKRLFGVTERSTKRRYGYGYGDKKLFSEFLGGKKKRSLPEIYKSE